VDVVLAIDMSSSMSGENLAAARRAASTFANLLDLRAGRDRAAVVGFNNPALLAQPLTFNRVAVQASRCRTGDAGPDHRRPGAR